MNRKLLRRCFFNRSWYLSFLFFFGFSSHLLHARVQNSELRALREARAYFEAGNYSHARTEYEKFLDEGLDSWKNEIVRYNLATTYLAEGKWEEAELRLQALVDEDVQLPLLKLRVLSNLALSRMLQVNTRLAAIKAKQDALPENYYQLSLLFRHAFQDIDKADSAWCALEAAEGAPACRFSPVLEEIGLQTKNLFKGFLDAFSRYRFAHDSKQDVHKSPLKNKLERLSIAYVAALIKDVLHEVDLKDVLSIQTGIENDIKSGNSLVVDDYAKAQKYLKLGIRSLSGSQQEKARLFTVVARFYVGSLLEQVDFSANTKTKPILENAIVKEEFVLLLNRLRMQVAGEADDLTDIDRLMPELQKTTLKAADQFLEVVIARQKEAFSAQEIQQSRCQCHPWDEVIPLFNEGYERALLVYHRLQFGGMADSLIERLGKSVVEYWKEALAKLKAFSPSENRQPEEQQKQPKNQPTQQPEKAQGAPEKEQQRDKLNSVLRLIQEMENDDHSQPELLKSPPGIREGVERPW